MFHKILAAIDASESSKKVFDEALSLAKLHSAELMLLHVLSPLDEGYPTLMFPGAADVYPNLYDEIIKSYKLQWHEFEEKNLDILRSLATEASNAGVSAEFSQNTGDAGKTICNVASSWRADLIVMGRRGHRGLSELLLGSVSNYVIHHSSCSVLTIQGNILSTSDALQTEAQTAVVA
jgi:nucleotide-binding universal stress UspA family protein